VSARHSATQVARSRAGTAENRDPISAAGATGFDITDVRYCGQNPKRW
jgi:hypothetical protein